MVVHYDVVIIGRCTVKPLDVQYLKCTPKSCLKANSSNLNCSETKHQGVMLQYVSKEHPLSLVYNLPLDHYIRIYIMVFKDTNL